MKLLYCILFIVVAANADSEPPTREDLNNVANLILQQLQGAPQTIDKVIADTNVIVTQKLLENPRVNNTKVTLNGKIAEILVKGDEELDDESQRIFKCGVSIIEGFNKIVIDISNDLLKKVIHERFNKNGDFLSTLRKDMSDVKDALENHREEEIKTCLDEKTKCRLTGEFLSKTEEYFSFVDIIEPILRSKVKSSDEYFNSLEIGNIIVTKLSKPAYECLNPQKV